MSKKVASPEIADERRRTVPRRVFCTLTGMALLLFFGAPMAHAAEEQTHLFDATLSLTGNCSKSAIDSVEDPGCPGGSHPPQPIQNPTGTAIDLHGDRYVASLGPFSSEEAGRIDVFDSSGKFLTEIPNRKALGHVAVDSEGNLYAVEAGASGTGLYLYVPSAYSPATGKMQYADPPSFVVTCGGEASVAVNTTNDHVFIDAESNMAEFGSAAEGNAPLGEFGSGKMYWSRFFAIDSSRKRIYVSAYPEDLGGGHEPLPTVFVFDLESPHERVGEINGATTPEGSYNRIAGTGGMSLAVNEESGHVFVGQLGEVPKKKIFEFEEDGGYVSTIAHEFDTTIHPQIAVDNGSASPTNGYLFIPNGVRAVGHHFAFAPKHAPKPPVLGSLFVSGVTEEEAVLNATIDPEGSETAYRFEYTTEQQFEAEGFTGAELAKKATLGAGGEQIAVSANLHGLVQGIAYHYRVVAESAGGEDEGEAGFSTFVRPSSLAACPNDPLRTGLSALLPDCRAYELVTPSNTNGHAPHALDSLGFHFPTREASPEGGKVSFQTQGGPVPGFPGTGSWAGDPYLVTRRADGWVTAAAGAQGTEAEGGPAGSVSPDQGYSFVEAEGSGSLAQNPASPSGHTTYVRYPDGHFEVLGQGSLGFDYEAKGELIGADGSHIIFRTDHFAHAGPTVQLEPQAPPSGTSAIYDRTPDGTTHVVSLLPGELTPAAGEDALYQGASLDGRAVAFSIGNVLYLRYENSETFEIGENVAFAGIAEGGSRLFYQQGGDLFAFDIEGEARIPFSAAGDVIPVNIAADGAVAYFISPSVLSGEANPHGALPQHGEENLYLSREGQISFIGTVTKEDAIDTPGRPSLGHWMSVFGASGASGRVGLNTTRVTPDGNTLLFESEADLTGYDLEGHPQVFRYDSGANSLSCISCNPTGVQATGEGVLGAPGSDGPLSFYNIVDNLSVDGKRAFFESTEKLLLADTDGVRDVYEWEDEGVGSCEESDGCLYLITSGTSPLPNYLYAISSSGNDVFFLTSDLLLPSRDPDETPSIYDARVDGGFPDAAAVAGSCLGEACQPAAVAPSDPTPGSSAYEGSGNVKVSAPKARCPKGKKARAKHHCAGRKPKSHEHANRNRRTHR